MQQTPPVGDGAVLADHFVPYVSAGATVVNLFPAGDPELGIDEVSVIAAAMH